MTTVIPTQIGKGWWNPTPFSMRRRAVYHYVNANGRILCGKWTYVGLGLLDAGRDNHSDNCAQCRKKKLALEDARDRKALKMRSQGKKPFSRLRSLERQRRIGIPPKARRDKPTFL